jgi:RNA polymerase sigma-70 factor (ECF subfamily)
MAIKRRHLRLVKDQIKPEEVSLDTSSFEAIPDEDELDLLLDEVSDEEFGAVETKDARPVKLKEWKAEEFASIYVRFRPHLERHARKWLSNQSQVDEVVQDAFLYLMVSLPELDSEIGVLKFMKWKVKNLCLDIYRASGKA